MIYYRHSHVKEGLVSKVYKIGGADDTFVLSPETVDEIVRRLHSLLDKKIWNLTYQFKKESPEVHRVCLVPFRLPTRAINYNAYVIVLDCSHQSTVFQMGDVFTFDNDRLVISREGERWTFENFV